MPSDTLSQEYLELITESIFSGSGDACKVHLYTNQISLTPATKISDLVEVSADWYAPISANYGAVYQQTNFNVAMSTGLCQWTYAGSAAAPIVVYGWYVTDTSSTLLHSSGAFAVPQTMGSELDAILLYSTYSLTPTLQFS